MSESTSGERKTFSEPVDRRSFSEAILEVMGQMNPRPAPEGELEAEAEALEAQEPADRYNPDYQPQFDAAVDLVAQSEVPESEMRFRSGEYQHGLLF